jgi:hypothetical protein
MRTLCNGLLPRVLALAALVTAVSVGCTKDSPPAAPKVEASILGDALLTKLPTSTAGFLVFDLSGEGWKNLKASPWAESMNGLNSLSATVEKLKDSGAGEDEVKLAETALAALQKLGLISSDGKSTADQVISKGVAFIGAKQGPVPVDAGVYLAAAPATDLKDKLAVLKTLLKDSDLKITDEKVGEVDGFKAAPEELEGQELGLYVAATKSELGISLSKQTLEPLFSNTKTPTLDNLRNLPEFKKAEQAVRSSEAPVSFGFLSVAQMMPLLEQAKDENFDPKDLPLESVALFAGFSKQYVNQLAVAVAPRNDTQKKVLAAFEGATLPSTSLKLPKDSAFGLSLNTSVVARLDGAADSLEEAAMVTKLPLVKEIRGVTLGTRSSNGGSPFPDIFLAIDTDKPAETSKSLEELISLGLMSAGQETQWQSKKISETDTRYFTTIIGAGVYMAPVEGSKAVLLGTSEKAITDLLAASSDASKGFTSALSAGLQARVPKSGLGLLYVNFPQVANVMDSVKGSLGMLTGGDSSEIDKTFNSAKVRTMGVTLGDVSYIDGVFKLQSAFDVAGK